ncbi:MAG: low molecular weight phosphotyrosine protein phosphatase [Phycisphaeraceae bacterium]|nr:low molecular weight phosphotyrosine protein phosphatase [Phycisphaerae bacterium]MBX3391405.1 low molecular weight phosphotyrosine protein phosphatase [Phycisphaeraceae bacterium]HRJ50251.1 low molecular weight protein-tyrosine-phosphatase [Phycisphaerales bacterium]
MPTNPRDGSQSDRPARRGVLFVCTGNICRSPLAEAIFRHLADRRGVAELFEIESCGTGGWHAGQGADPRTVAVARRYGIPMNHVARTFDARRDPARFEWILAMDRSHQREVSHVVRPAERVRLIREFDATLASHPNPDPNHDLDVPDPYYGAEDGFDEMYHMLDRACRGLLEHLAPR